MSLSNHLNLWPKCDLNYPQNSLRYSVKWLGVVHQINQDMTWSDPVELKLNILLNMSCHSHKHQSYTVMIASTKYKFQQRCFIPNANLLQCNLAVYCNAGHWLLVGAYILDSNCLALLSTSRSKVEQRIMFGRLISLLFTFQRSLVFLKTNLL